MVERLTAHDRRVNQGQAGNGLPPFFHLMKTTTKRPERSTLHFRDGTKRRWPPQLAYTIWLGVPAAALGFHALRRFPCAERRLIRTTAAGSHVRACWPASQGRWKTPRGSPRSGKLWSDPSHVWPQLLGPLKAHQDDAPVPFWTNLDNVALADARGLSRLHGENHLTAVIDRRIHSKSIMGANLPVKPFPHPAVSPPSACPADLCSWLPQIFSGEAPARPEPINGDSRWPAPV